MADANTLPTQPVLDEQGRPEPPQAGDEITMLLAFLDYQRATFAWKGNGLDATGLDTTVGASTMTLGGMLKHLAWVEDYWFSVRLHRNPPESSWDQADWDADEDWDWHSAAENAPAELHQLWQDAVGRSRSRISQALGEDGLDGLARKPWPNGESPTLRWILLHMIEEYARHNGHADLIRESVDGQTGE